VHFLVVEKVPVRAPAVALAPSPPAPSPTSLVAAALVAPAELVTLMRSPASTPFDKLRTGGQRGKAQ